MYRMRVYLWPLYIPRDVCSRTIFRKWVDGTWVGLSWAHALWIPRVFPLSNVFKDSSHISVPWLWTVWMNSTRSYFELYSLKTRVTRMLILQMHWPFMSRHISIGDHRAWTMFAWKSRFWLLWRPRGLSNRRDCFNIMLWRYDYCEDPD